MQHARILVSWLAFVVGPAVVAVGAEPKKSPASDADAKAAAKGDRYDPIVDEFIQADIGMLRGQAGRAAFQAFNNLNTSDAIPALVRGVNKSATMQQSCPIMVISQRLSQLINNCNDQQLLRQAANDLRAAPNARYGNYVNSLRQAVEQRARTLQGEATEQQMLTGGTPGQLRRSRMPLERWTFKDLEAAVGEDTDEQLMRVLGEIADRKGPEYTELLAKAVASMQPENKEIARGFLARRLMRMTETTLKAKLQDSDVEVRAMAARATGYKGLTAVYPELIAMLRDPNAAAAAEAKAALVKLSGEDFGPKGDATAMEWFDASKRWEQWLKDKNEK